MIDESSKSVRFDPKTTGGLSSFTCLNFSIQIQRLIRKTQRESDLFGDPLRDCKLILQSRTHLSFSEENHHIQKNSCSSSKLQSYIK